METESPCESLPQQNCQISWGSVLCSNIGFKKINRIHAHDVYSNNMAVHKSMNSKSLTRYSLLLRINNLNALVNTYICLLKP